jgi:hypothetical protein
MRVAAPGHLLTVPATQTEAMILRMITGVKQSNYGLYAEQRGDACAESICPVVNKWLRTRAALTW